MDKNYLHEKIAGLRSRCGEGPAADSPAGFVGEPQLNKKMLRIKKKLVSLEMERCQKKIEHRDLSKIDRKISEQKALFQECYKQR